jgi:hypothetical protein
MSTVTGLKWTHSKGQRAGYVVRVPNNAFNGTTGRRWYAVALQRGIGHFRNKRNAVAAVLKTVTAETK